MLTPTPRVEQTDDEVVEDHTLRSLFDSEETRLLRYAFSIVRRREVAEEIVQDVFLQLHLMWDTVECPKAWLYRCVRNQVYSHLRKNRRETFASDAMQDNLEDDDHRAPMAMMERMEATAALKQILSELDENDRRLVTLKYFEGKKYREISDEMGLSVGNVGYRLHHLLKLIAQRLGPFGVDGA